MKTEELTLHEAALAWAQGKRVEAEAIDANDGAGWELICLIGGAIGKRDPNVFIAPVVHRFRLAPEPPAKKFRPWKPEEVPVGAIIKAKEHTWRSLIIGVSGNGYISISGGGFGSEFALENHEHSLDGGKTWLPCGVKVSE